MKLPRSGFTPGEWKIENTDEDIRIVSSLGIHDAIASVACIGLEAWPEPLIVANKREAMANARLIARAPEMAELLREIHQWFKSEKAHFEYDRIEKLLKEIDG